MSHCESVSKNLFHLIEISFSSDAAFERAASLPPKTVSNWRRGRSATYMKMLPTLASVLGVNPRDLIGEEAKDGVENAEEARIWHLLRRAGQLPEGEKSRLYAALTSVLTLALGEDEG
jgi:hypothetical protein